MGEAKETASARRDAPRGPAQDLFARRAILVVGVVILIALMVLFLAYILQVLLAVFGGILFAILLRIPTDWLSRHTRLSGQVALVLVMVGLAGLLSLFGWIVAPSMDRQFVQFGELLPVALERIAQLVGQSAWGRQLLMGTLNLESLPASETLLLGVTGAFSSVMGFISSLFVSLLLGLYLAFQPDMYVEGVIKLFPQDRRQRVREVVEAVGDALKWWLIGRLFAMVVLGVGVGIGLAVLNVPLALILAIIVGLLSFVPVVGGVIAVLPIALFALVQGPSTLLYALILYYGAQTVETYVLTPAVQQYVVSLPPAVAILAQVMLGVVAGSLGVTLAFPLAVVGMILVQMLYIEDVLGDTVPKPRLGKRSRAQRTAPAGEEGSPAE